MHKSCEEGDLNLGGEEEAFTQWWVLLFPVERNFGGKKENYSDQIKS